MKKSDSDHVNKGASSTSPPFALRTAFKLSLRNTELVSGDDAANISKLIFVKYSQPITSLSFVSVFVLSVVYLGERVEAQKMLGIALVFAGVWFISRTHHDTGTRDEGTQ